MYKVEGENKSGGGGEEGTYQARLRGPLLRLEEDGFGFAAAGAFFVRAR